MPWEIFKIFMDFFQDSNTITIETWNSYAPGIYFLHIDTGDHSRTFKLTKE